MFQSLFCWISHLESDPGELAGPAFLVSILVLLDQSFRVPDRHVFDEMSVVSILVLLDQSFRDRPYRPIPNILLMFQSLFCWISHLEWLDAPGLNWIASFNPCSVGSVI